MSMIHASDETLHCNSAKIKELNVSMYTCQATIHCKATRPSKIRWQLFIDNFYLGFVNSTQENELESMLVVDTDYVRNSSKVRLRCQLNSETFGDVELRMCLRLNNNTTSYDSIFFSLWLYVFILFCFLTLGLLIAYCIKNGTHEVATATNIVYEVPLTTPTCGPTPSTSRRSLPTTCYTSEVLPATYPMLEALPATCSMLEAQPTTYMSIPFYDYVYTCY